LTAGIIAWNNAHPEQAYQLHESAKQGVSNRVSRKAALLKVVSKTWYPDATIGVHAWLLQTGSTLRMAGKCNTYRDDTGRELIFVKFHPGIFDDETLQVERQGFATVRSHGEEHTLRKRNLELPSMLLHGIADQGVRHGMECIGSNWIRVGSGWPHGVFHISADRKDAYQKLDFYNSGCVLLTSTAGFVVDRERKRSNGKSIDKPYDWVGASYKGVVVSQVRNIGREYVVHPKSLMILGALFDKKVLRAFLSTQVDKKWIQRAHRERSGEISALPSGSTSSSSDNELEAKQTNKPIEDR
jgi:hypothetical protein